MAVQPTFAALQSFYEAFSGSNMRKQAGDTAQLSRAKLGPRPAAVAAPPAADAWAIPAVQRHGSVCTDAAHQTDCMDLTAYPAAPAAEPEGSADVSAAATAAAPLPTLDLELTAKEAQWLVQPPALLGAPAPVATPAPAAEQPATTAAPTTSQQAAPSIAPSRSAAAPLAALRRRLRRLAGGLRRRLAAAACMARPTTLECGGCPGRRLGNASSGGVSAEWTVVHINWT